MSLTAVLPAFATLGLISLGIYSIALGCGAQARRQKIPEHQGLREGISVLKPLKGVDEGLEQNLISIFEQDHPNFEVLLGAGCADDPALEVARRVAARYPHIPSRIVSGDIGEGYNPKVRMLRALLEYATKPSALISDSNVRPPADYLRRLQDQKYASGAALVHSVLAGVGGEGLGGRLEDLQLSGWVFASVCFTEAGHHPCVVGKSMLFDRAALEQAGGLAGVKDVLAEDYITGAKLQQAGYKVVLSPYTLPVVSGQRELAVFWNRYVRWGQMRRHIEPGFYFGEIMVQPLPWLLPVVLFGEAPLAAVAALALLTKWLLETATLYDVDKKLRWTSLPLLPLKDTLIWVMWLVSFFLKTVSWRGHRMVLGAGSQLTPVEEATRRSGSWLRRPLSA